MCIFFLVLILGPRFTALLWWIFDSARFSFLFDSWIIPLLGLIFLPWSTIAFLFFGPDGINGFEYILFAFAVLVDFGSYLGGVFSRLKK